MKTAETEKHDHLTVDSADTVDWHRHTFPLGVRTEMTEADPPFLALHPDALRVLEAVLTTKFPGADFSAAEEYEQLSELATWCRMVQQWAKKRSSR